jgi:hypothetical protein
MVIEYNPQLLITTYDLLKYGSYKLLIPGENGGKIV